MRTGICIILPVLFIVASAGWVIWRECQLRQYCFEANIDLLINNLRRAMLEKDLTLGFTRGVSAYCALVSARRWAIRRGGQCEEIFFARLEEELALAHIGELSREATYKSLLLDIAHPEA